MLENFFLSNWSRKLNKIVRWIERRCIKKSEMKRWSSSICFEAMLTLNWNFTNSIKPFCRLCVLEDIFNFGLNDEGWKNILFFFIQWFHVVRSGSLRFFFWYKRNDDFFERKFRFIDITLYALYVLIFDKLDNGKNICSKRTCF